MKLRDWFMVTVACVAFASGATSGRLTAPTPPPCPEIKPGPNTIGVQWDGRDCTYSMVEATEELRCPRNSKAEQVGGWSSCFEGDEECERSSKTAGSFWRCSEPPIALAPDVPPDLERKEK